MYTDPLFFFFNDTATTEIYTLSLHDALPISAHNHDVVLHGFTGTVLLDETLRGHPMLLSNVRMLFLGIAYCQGTRSEEHTSELQSHSDLVCRLLLEKKKTNHRTRDSTRTHTL